MKFGLEIEKFLQKGRDLVVVPKEFPADDEGFQVEARGKPFYSITEAVFSAMGDLQRIRTMVTEDGYSLRETAVERIPRDLKLEARRFYKKGTLDYQNLYGFKRHRVAISESTAGIHLSVTNPRTVNDSDKVTKTTVYKAWDFPTFFRYLDKQFEKEIKDAKRRPGFYEVKSDGRIEYRSLPTTASLIKLIDVVDAYKF